MPDSSSTTSPTGASLSDILFSFVLEKYIVCDVCGLRSPSFESISVLYEYFIVIQDQYKIIGTTLTINRIYHSNNMHTYNIID